MDIKKVVIIGSGTMGSGIAAQVANAGIPISLLDLPSKEGSRNQIAENAKERILQSRPPLLIEKNKINLISAGNTEDDFNLVCYDMVSNPSTSGAYMNLQESREYKTLISQNRIVLLDEILNDILEL